VPVSQKSVIRLLKFLISDDWLNVNTKCSIPFCSKLMILPVPTRCNRSKRSRHHVGHARHWHLKG